MMKCPFQTGHSTWISKFAQRAGSIIANMRVWMLHRCNEWFERTKVAPVAEYGCKTRLVCLCKEVNQWLNRTIIMQLSERFDGSTTDKRHV